MIFDDLMASLEHAESSSSKMMTFVGTPTNKEHSYVIIITIGQSCKSNNAIVTVFVETNTVAAVMSSVSGK